MTPELIQQDLQGEDYYMFFRVEEKAPRRLKELDEVRAKVEDSVLRIAKRERLEAWLGELKSQSKLRIYADRLPHVETPTDAPESSDETGDAVEMN